MKVDDVVVPWLYCPYLDLVQNVDSSLYPYFQVLTQIIPIGFIVVLIPSSPLLFLYVYDPSVSLPDVVFIFPFRDAI